MSRGFQRVLIANRGEIAVRIAHTLREMNIEAIAVYSAADRDALHVRVADRAVYLGPAAAPQSYLDVAAVVQAAKDTGADAIHPGYGFLSERPALAEACAAAGITLIGPSAQAMRVMGDKASARAAMQAAGVPIVPGSDGPLTAAQAGPWARRIGFPVLLKASAGGGGKGMRLVDDEEGLVESLRGAQSEARKAFGDDAVYMEKAIVRPRHIEVQIFADAHGHVVSVGERECSMQRRHQKVIEEAPSAVMTPDLRTRMGAVACQAARAVDYVGAGTIEFLLDADGHFYFLEMNTRLQVEHAVTEAVFGVDLLRAQVVVAQGGPLPWQQDALSPRGHAIEARLYAEDPDRNFLPSPGTVRDVQWPMGPGIRVDAGIAAGATVSPYYDPMVAKIIAWGADRASARQRLCAALRDTHVGGLTTNRAFLLHALAAPAFVAGDYHTGTLAEIQATAPAAAPNAIRRAAMLAMALQKLRTDAHRQRSRGALHARSDAWRQGLWQARGS